MGAAEDLATLIDTRSHQVAQHHQHEWIERGRVNEAGGLEVARGAFVIPEHQYEVAKHLLQPPTQDGLVSVLDDTSGAPLQHNHLLTPLQPGDQVLVAWYDGATRPCVIAVL